MDWEYLAKHMLYEEPEGLRIFGGGENMDCVRESHANGLSKMIVMVFLFRTVPLMPATALYFFKPQQSQSGFMKRGRTRGT